MQIDYVDFSTFANRYCERQEQTPDSLRAILSQQRVKFDPVGWVMLECQLMGSSWFGNLVILPYGPDNTLKEVPQTPLSLDGLASRTAVPVAVLLADRLEDRDGDS